MENAVEYAFNIETSNYILEESLPIKLRESEKKINTVAFNTLKEFRKNYIKKIINKYGQSTDGKKQAADVLGIGIATLYRKIKEYNL